MMTNNTFRPPMDHSDSSQQGQEDMQRTLLSQKAEMNVAEIIATLRHQELVYQAVLEVGQRAISAVSLFDMLS